MVEAAGGCLGDVVLLSHQPRGADGLRQAALPRPQKHRPQDAGNRARARARARGRLAVASFRRRVRPAGPWAPSKTSWSRGPAPPEIDPPVMITETDLPAQATGLLVAHAKGRRALGGGCRRSIKAGAGRVCGWGVGGCKRSIKAGSGRVGGWGGGCRRSRTGATRSRSRRRGWRGRWRRSSSTCCAAPSTATPPAAPPSPSSSRCAPHPQPQPPPICPAGDVPPPRPRVSGALRAGRLQRARARLQGPPSPQPAPTHPTPPHPSPARPRRRLRGPPRRQARHVASCV